MEGLINVPNMAKKIGLSELKPVIRKAAELRRLCGIQFDCSIVGNCQRETLDIAPGGKTLEESNANLDEVVALAKEFQGGKIHPLWGTAQLFMHPRYMHGGATSSELGVYAYGAAQVKKAIEEESNANLDEVVALAKELQGGKIHPLWGTAQLFMHPHYMHGGATSSELGVYAYGAAQVKKVIEVIHCLGGENYVYWGGREGYQTLWNTDMERELNHMARFLEAAVAYKKNI